MNQIKKIMSGILALTLCISSSAIAVNASSTTYFRGDINGDGTANLVDITYLKNVLSGKRGSTNDRLTQRLDVNLDGVISERDVEMLTKINLHEIPSDMLNYGAISDDILAPSNKSYQRYNAQTGATYGSTYTLNAVNSVPESTSTYSIIGSDNRYVDYSNTGVVKINSSLGTGTGFVVGSHTILTAAQCVYNTTSNTPSTNVTYTMYSSNGTIIRNETSAVRYHIPTDYINLSSNFCDYDYAIITVNEDLSNYINFDLGMARLALNNVLNDNSAPVPIYVTGYDNINSSSLRNEVTTAQGTLINRKVYINELRHNVDTVSSEVGGPVYVTDSNGKKTVIGINSTTNVSSYNVGKRIDTNVIQFVYNNPNL